MTVKPHAKSLVIMCAVRLIWVGQPSVKPKSDRILYKKNIQYRLCMSQRHPNKTKPNLIQWNKMQEKTNMRWQNNEF